jgi:hypothetical protein
VVDETAAEPAERRANCGNDDCAGHAKNPSE